MQSLAAATYAATPGTGFAGLVGADGGGWMPPDTDGDIGGGYFVQTVNDAIGMWNASTRASVKKVSLDTFFGNIFGSSDNCGHAGYNMGDAVVLFDTTVSKWIVSDFNWPSASGPYSQCFAVSNTSDPTAGWHGYRIASKKASDKTTYMNDYPKLSLTPNAVLMTANLFDVGKNYKFAGARMWAIDRTALFCVTSCGSLKVLVWDAGSVPNTNNRLYASVQPVNVKFPVAGGQSSKVGGIFVSDSQSTSIIDVWTLPTVNWSLASPSYNLSAKRVTSPTFSLLPSAIPQKGTTQLLDAMSDRLMTGAELTETASTFRIYLSRTASANNVGAVRWVQMTAAVAPAPSFTVKAGTYAPDVTHRWMSSLAVNKKGEVALGYSMSSSAINPGIGISGMTATAVAAATPELDVTEWTKAGSVSQAGCSSASACGRWGDYSAMSVDPAGCTFWYTQMYYSATTTGKGDWQTWIQPITLTSCP